MISGLIVVGLVSFVAGFVLRVGAFALFAFAISVFYFVLIFVNSTIFTSLISAGILFVTMQVAYAIGVLVPLPVCGESGRWRFCFLKRRSAKKLNDMNRL